MAVALPNNLYTMWGIVILAGIGIGGIVVSVDWLLYYPTIY